MESIDRKIWKRASTIGLIFTSVCLVICLIQYYCDPEADTFQKIVRLSIHFLAVNSFLFLFFNPLSFNIYAFLFYFYGCGNFLDNGNILGAICISASLVFLENSGFLKNRRKLKIPCLLIIPFLHHRTVLPHGKTDFPSFRILHTWLGLHFIPDMDSPCSKGRESLFLKIRENHQRGKIHGP